jgi:hypothetical protein
MLVYRLLVPEFGIDVCFTHEAYAHATYRNTFGERPTSTKPLYEIVPIPVHTCAGQLPI